MPHTVTLNTDIPANRELRITLPLDVPAGPAQILLEVSTPLVAPPGAPFSNLLNSEFFGMWRDRSDIEANPEFAANLRSLAWNRSRE